MDDDDEKSLARALRERISQIRVLPDPTPEECARSDADENQARLHDLLLERGVPPKLAREVAKLSGHKPRREHALRQAMSWWAIGAGEPHRDVLALSGQRGRGKSYAAAQVVGRVPYGEGCPKFANARKISDWLHTTSDPRSARELGRVRSASVLVLDDLGWEHLDRSGYVLSSFVGLVDDRIQAEHRTVITTNMGETQFRERYGDALHDRVRGYGMWVDVETGRSMR